MNSVPTIWKLNLTLIPFWFLTDGFTKIFILNKAKLTPLPKTQQSMGGLRQQAVAQVGKEHAPPAEELFHIDRHSYRCISATNE